MADHRIGKIYVELDLDSSRYLKSQRTLLKEAQGGADILEKNFRNLGTRSSATFDLMRAQAVKSFEAIKKSSRSTTQDIIRAEKAKADKIRQINAQQYGHTTSMLANLKKHWLAVTGAIIAAWYAVGTAVRKASDVVLAAARYETLGVSMRVVGNNAGYTYQELTELQKGLEKTGISMRGSRQAIIKMAQAQLDLSKATELARGAQHAAVIGAMDSTEAFNQMVYGIQSANVRVLRTIGINVSFEDSYKKLETQLDRSKETFTQAEKAGARLGATLEALTRLSGTYEAAMETAGKQLLSLNRHFDNLKVRAGAAFTPALLEAVQSITGEVKDLNQELSGESTQKIHEWGVSFRLTLIDIKIELMNVALLLDKIGGTMTTVMVGLFSLGNAIGNENSQRQYAEWMKKNIEYKKRYWQTVIDIIELEEKQVALEFSLTDAGKAQAKAKTDALEKVRLLAAAATKGLDEQVAAEKRAKTAAEKHNKELEKAVKAMDKVTLASLPKYERALESIRRKYDELNKALDKHGAFVGKTTEEIAALYKNLYERMMDEVGDFAASFAKDELWTEALNRVQSTMADTFMKGMKGELDNFKDVFKSFCDVILRMWAEMAAAMTMKSIFGIGGAGQQGWGDFLSSIFGGAGFLQPAYESGDPRSSDFVGPLQQGVRGAQSAYSLYGAYGAYQGAGGGWAGMKAGAGSFFGTGGAGSAGGGWASSTMMGIPVWGWIAAAATFALDQFAKANLKSGQAEMNIGAYSPRDAEYLGSALGGDFFNDPFQEWVLGGLYGKGDRHTYGAYMDYALKEGDWKTGALGMAGMATDPTGGWAKMLGLDRGVAGWILNPIGTLITGILENKKRSYLTREYDYGYSLDGGWSQTGMTETREKRKGEDFREAADSMSESISNILNSFEELTTGFLGVIDEKWVNQFKTSMMELGDLGFRFNISAEDKGEFEDDMEASFSAALDGVINPVVSIATDFMRRATEEAFTSPEIEKVFGILNDNIADFLRDDMAQMLAIFDMPLPTTAEEFEAFIESLSANMEEVGAILEYFQTITALTDEISSGLARSSLTQSIIDINTNFLSLGETLMSVGVDLEKYPDFVRAWGIALAEATYGFSVDNIVEGLKSIMDAPTAMEAAEAFTLGFMEQVRDGMVNAITSAFTEMVYMQMLAPLAEAFLASAETPEELMAAAQDYINTVTNLMRDPAFLDSLNNWGAAMWEINQALPTAEQLAGLTDWEPADLSDAMAAFSGEATNAGQEIQDTADYFSETVRSSIDYSGLTLVAHCEDAGRQLVDGASIAAGLLADALANAPPSGGGDIPALQHGGIVTKPTYSLLGEAGYPEVVLPLGGGHKLTAQLEGDKSQEVTITIPLTVVTEDSQILKQETIKETFHQIKKRSKSREHVIYASGIITGY